MVIIAAVAVLLLDQIIVPGRALTFDAHIHITTITQFSDALKEGEFPVRWSNNFANYGLPLPIVAHQLPTYLGAVLTLVIGNPVTAYKWMLFIGALGSAVSLYAFLRKFSATIPAVTATILFIFGPYRIINIYIRGAMPEIFASMFLPLVLLGLYEVCKQKKKRGLAVLYLGVLGMFLSHPMVVVTSSLLILGYGLYLAWPVVKHWKEVLFLAMAGGLAVASSSYYIVPLLLEKKYFYIGQSESLFAQGSALSLEQFLQPAWYFFKGHPGPRGDFIIVGAIEIALLCIGVVAWLFLLVGKQKKFVSQRNHLVFWLIMSLIFMFLMTPAADLIYLKVPGFSEVQFPWRMLTSLLVTTSAVVAITLQRVPKRWQALSAAVLVIVVLITRVPQLYSKNSAQYDTQAYHFIQTNLHTQNLNTIWSQNTAEYPVKSEQFKVLGGMGTVQAVELRNSSRKYLTSSTEALRLIDFTFYFPGWKVFVDGQEVPIEFQDIEYRGLITYQVPAGEHTVDVRYTHTKVRQLGFVLSGCALIVSVGFFGVVFSKKYWTLLIPRKDSNLK